MLQTLLVLFASRKNKKELVSVVIFPDLICFANPSL